MPLQATSGGRSLGFLKTVPEVLTGLKAVVMLALFMFIMNTDRPNNIYHILVSEGTTSF